MENFLDFSSTEEVESNFNYVNTGIHTFKVEGIAYQPVGPSVFEEKVRAGIKEHKLPQLSLALTCIATHAGKDCVGAKIIVGLLEPMKNDPEKAKKQMNRILHILCNISSVESKEKTKSGIQSLKVKSFEDLAAKLKGLTGRTVRYKIIADQTGKYPQLPNYYGGIAEPGDISDADSQLKYDPEKEGTRQMPAATAFENSNEDNNLFGNAADEAGDDLPF